jgi:hypothetical protein
MPPQQPDRLLDLFYQPFDFGAHGDLWSNLPWDVAARGPIRNRPTPYLAVFGR